MPRFLKDVARVTGRNDIDITDAVQGAKRVTNATSFERDSLLLFALVAAIAALLIVGQAIVRYTASAVTDLDVLRALGLTRRETVIAAVGGPVAAAAVAAVVSVTGALLASPLFPIGVGKKVEPTPGLPRRLGGPAARRLPAAGTGYSHRLRDSRDLARTPWRQSSPPAVRRWPPGHDASASPYRSRWGRGWLSKAAVDVQRYPRAPRWSVPWRAFSAWSPQPPSTPAWTTRSTHRSATGRPGRRPASSVSTATTSSSRPRRRRSCPSSPTFRMSPA